jgi:glycosyltransferase 2 family protein
VTAARATKRTRLLQVLWAVGVIVSLALMLLVLVRAVSGLDVESLELGWLVVSGLLFAVSWVGFAAAWVALNRHGRPVDQMARWVHSQLLRYLPGAIWAPIARASSVPGQRSRRVATVVVEALLFLASAVSVGGLLGGIAVDPLLFLACPAPLGALLIVRFGAGRFDVSLGRATTAMVWLLPSWVLYGLASAAAQAAVGAGPSVGAVGAASLLAWSVGFVAVFAPGGAGVREVVYGAVLSGTAPSSRIAGGAIAARLAFTVGELVVAVVLAGWVRRRRSPSEGGSPEERSSAQG